MSNQPNPVASREKLHTQHYGAHSGSHAGGSEYHDGGSLSHYGGNDDYLLEHEEEEEFDENIANGNESESADDEDYGKYHSGL